MVVQWKVKMLAKRTCMILFSHNTALMNDEKYTKLLYRIVFGKNPRLNPPITYNEHLCKLKLDSNGKDLAPYADKFAVREYVGKKIGEQYLNLVYGVYDSFDSIDFDALPDAFALKATHGSSFNIIVDNKSRLNRSDAKARFDKWLKINYYYGSREKQYIYIKPRIICDAYLEPSDGSMLNEVKLFCILGKVRFIMDSYEKNGVRYSNIYDEQWKFKDVTYGFPNNQSIGVPQNKEDLVRLAELLASEFAFVRVDLYNIDRRIYFSELTFYPGGGLTPLIPKAFDDEMGRYFDIANECEKR